MCTAYNGTFCAGNFFGRVCSALSGYATSSPGCICLGSVATSSEFTRHHFIWTLARSFLIVGIAFRMVDSGCLKTSKQITPSYLTNITRAVAQITILTRPVDRYCFFQQDCQNDAVHTTAFTSIRHANRQAHRHKETSVLPRYAQANHILSWYGHGAMSRGQRSAIVEAKITCTPQTLSWCCLPLLC